MVAPGWKFEVAAFGFLVPVLLEAALLMGQGQTPNYHSTCCHPIPPEKMVKLPTDIRQQLKTESCLIPQNSFTRDDPQPNNAIHGEWAAHGQEDWAVLCLQPQQLSVRLFWGGKYRCDDKIVIARYQPNDGHWDDPETVLWPADAKKIRSYDQAFGNRKLPRLDHSGLEVGGEEATTIYYCSEGKWMQLAGND